MTALTADEILAFWHPKIHPKPPTEKVVQQKIRATALVVGFKVRSTSQYRASGVAVGLPDLFLTHRLLGIAAFWETKTYEAKAWKAGSLVLKPRQAPQLEFAEDMAACRILCGWGALPEFYGFLIGQRLAERVGGQILLRTRR